MKTFFNKAVLLGVIVSASMFTAAYATSETSITPPGATALPDFKNGTNVNIRQHGEALVPDGEIVSSYMDVNITEQQIGTALISVKTQILMYIIQQRIKLL